MNDPMADSGRIRSTRRALVGGLVGLGAAGILNRRAMAQTATPTVPAAAPILVALWTSIDPFPMDLLTNVAGVLNTQVQRDFGPIWNINAEVKAFDTRTEQIPATAWQYEVAYPYDEDKHPLGVTVAGHDFTPDPTSTTTGLPYAWGGYIEGGDGWIHTASHEILEMLANPFFTQFHQSTGPVLLPATGNYLQEICDPCEKANPADTIDGMVVSDFVLPSYYDVQNDTGSDGSFSFFKHVTRPLTPLIDGYQEYQTASNQWRVIQWDNNALTDTADPYQ
jgi:hypothetical protein